MGLPPLPTEAAPSAEPLLGAYGLRLRGVEKASALLVRALPEWPLFELSARIGDGALAGERVTDDRAELTLRTGGRIDIERTPGRVTYTVPRRLRHDELVHPYLAPAAALISHWLGRESFHAGSFVANGGCIALLGERESGKSSTLAWLALKGHTVVCDDMLVLDEARPFLGPRSVDLRQEAARHLGAGKGIGVTGARERWRVDLESHRGEPPPLAGWVFLSWGSRIELEKIPASERLPRLFAQRGLRLPPSDPTAIIELAALPAWELRRPRDWTSLGPAAERLLAAVSA
jgi:hypothetical protein